MDAGADARPEFHGPEHPCGCNAEPDAPAARPYGADGVGTVRGIAAPSVHRESASQDPARRGLGSITSRSHEPLLHLGVRRPRASRQTVVDLVAGTAEQYAWRRPGCPTPEERRCPA